MMADSILKVRNSLKGVGRAPVFVQDFCRENSIPEKYASSLCVVLDEMLPNISQITTSPRICLEIVKHDQVLECIISSESEKYDLAQPTALVWPAAAADSRISNLSMKIIHKLVDKIECVHDAGITTTRLFKNLV